CTKTKRKPKHENKITTRAKGHPCQSIPSPFSFQSLLIRVPLLMSKKPLHFLGDRPRGAGVSVKCELWGALTELPCLVMLNLAILAKQTEWGATYVKG
ncbi:MAG: hypothetical protein M0R49_07275, partial [Limnochordia bacterium]|nr:hypothetical protein [Limnochordia bacterium]